ncbi:MAG: MarR family winged helix-turn-helix transcriptional regulator [Pigmentiphaga sp.]
MPRTDDLSLELFDSLHTVMHWYRARQLRSLRDGAFELTPMEFKALGYVARHPGCTQSDLVERFGRDKGQLARLLKGLRDRGLLQARADPTDKRSILLEPSPTGERLHHILRCEAAEVARQATAGLSVPQRRAVLAALEVIRQNFEALSQQAIESGGTQHSIWSDPSHPE